MKRCARVALRKATYISLAVLFLVVLLPGCAVIGPLISIGGMAGLAQLQYASTAYTVGEFSYEYAVNDNDPGDVIEQKIDAVLTGKAFMMPDFTPDADELDSPDGAMLAEAGSDMEETSSMVGTPADMPALSAQSRQKRIDLILGRRTMQYAQFEHRRMDYLKAQGGGELSLRQTAMVTSPDLFQGAVDETSLR